MENKKQIAIISFSTRQVLIFSSHLSTHSLLHAPHAHHSEQITDNPQKTEDVLLSKELQYNKCVICTKDTVEQV